MDSKDSGFSSILSNNTNIYNESTPIKHERTFSQSISDLNAFTPINNSSQFQLTDIDSVYFSRLKKPRYSHQFSPVSSFSQRFRTTSYFSQFNSFLGESSQCKIDFISEFNDRGMIHINQLILTSLSNKDYIKCSRVCKNWNFILDEDLKRNKKRRNSIKKEKILCKNEKENLSPLVKTTNQSINSTSLILEEEEQTQSILIHQDNDDSILNFEETHCTDKSFNKLCSAKSRKNLKRL